MHKTALFPGLAERIKKRRGGRDHIFETLDARPDGADRRRRAGLFLRPRNLGRPEHH